MQAHEAKLPELVVLRKPLLGPSAFHLHCVIMGSGFWSGRAGVSRLPPLHPEAAAAYEQLKKTLASRLSRTEYTEAKGPFIESILVAALNGAASPPRDDWGH